MPVTLANPYRNDLGQTVIYENDDWVRMQTQRQLVLQAMRLYWTGCFGDLATRRLYGDCQRCGCNQWHRYRRGVCAIVVWPNYLDHAPQRPNGLLGVQPLLQIYTK